MSAEIEGLVETSLNMGVMKIDEEGISTCFSVRSSVASAKDYLTSRLEQFTEMLGGKVSYHGDYPGWAYARESRLRDLCVRIYEKQYGEAPKIEVIHAGLECGIIGAVMPGLDMISFGPTLRSPHSPDERCLIPTVSKFYDFLTATLANAPVKE